jgi:BirA family biotin operon repressor/biotin-[acetyl-CoA-carboxylase] ligase
VAWRYEVTEASPSTNAEVAARFRDGERPGLALVTEHQTAGRGRLDRTWVTPARAALTVSFLLAPDEVPVGRWPWLPLIAGVAVVAAVRRTVPVVADRIGLKWPNDLLCGDPTTGDGERKLAGILSERVERADRAAAVVGVGLNVSQRPEELPVEAATSLVIEGVPDPDRTGLLLALGDELATRTAAWAAVAGEPAAVRSSYLSLCRTVGRRVRVQLPGDESLEGEAVDVDAEGRLVLQTAAGEQRVGAGDVMHVLAHGGQGG